MKVAHIYPANQHCGIGIYGKRLTEALHHCTIDTVHCASELFSTPKAIVQQLKGCDVVHAHYEPSVYTCKSKDRFDAVIGRTNLPVLTTVHEVYREFPWDYPRSIATSKSWLHRLVYDLRHPIFTRYRKLIANNFHSNTIHLHCHFHREIIQAMGFTAPIATFPHPVEQQPPAGNSPNDNGQPLRLGATGFINPGYNYELLFSILRALPNPWHFCWIGGARTQEQQTLHEQITQQVKELHWEDRFTITGWVSSSRQQQLLQQQDVVLALFKYRSSSGSLTSTVSVHRPIIATDIPLTRELQQEFGLLCALKPRADLFCKEILRLHSDRKARDTLKKNCERYCQKYNYASAAVFFAECYRELCRK
jgi:glycosyltransferase involved in cell wall biosynthesis